MITIIFTAVARPCNRSKNAVITVVGDAVEPFDVTCVITACSSEYSHRVLCNRKPEYVARGQQVRGQLCVFLQ
jgi:hypothetical protein